VEVYIIEILTNDGWEPMANYYFFQKNERQMDFRVMNAIFQDANKAYAQLEALAKAENTLSFRVSHYSRVEWTQ